MYKLTHTQVACFFFLKKKVNRVMTLTKRHISSGKYSINIL